MQLQVYGDGGRCVSGTLTPCLKKGSVRIPPFVPKSSSEELMDPRKLTISSMASLGVRALCLLTLELTRLSCSVWAHTEAVAEGLVRYTVHTLGELMRTQDQHRRFQQEGRWILARGKQMERDAARVTQLSEEVRCLLVEEGLASGGRSPQQRTA